MNLPAPTALFTPSWHAELELGYARFGDSTRPVQRRHKGPLRVQKHLYAEGPQVCQHIIVHPPGGIAGVTGWTSRPASGAMPGRKSPALARPNGIAPPAPLISS